MTLVRDIDLQVALIEYPDMKRYLRTFQVPIDPAYKTSFKLRPTLKDHIVVFKKKKLHCSQLWQTKRNIYHDNFATAPEESIQPNQIFRSCLRCRRFKKKCTRQLPECLNCASCDEICVYPSTKKRKSGLVKKNTITAQPSSAISSNVQQRRCSDLYRLLN